MILFQVLVLLRENRTKVIRRCDFNWKQSHIIKMKKNEKFIMTIDEVTTSLRTLIINKKGDIISSSQKKFTQIFAQSGWVEHDVTEIWGTQKQQLEMLKWKLILNLLIYKWQKLLINVKQFFYEIKKADYLFIML